MDIEDISVTLRDSSPASTVVLPRFPIESGSKIEEKAAPIVPGTQRIYLKTYGCSHNVSDSEYIQGILGSYGYRFTDDMDEADICVINSCTVKDPSQSAFLHLVQRARSEAKPVVVAGCVPQADRKLKGLEDVSVVGIQQIDRVLEVVEETLKGNVVRHVARRGCMPGISKREPYY